MSNVQNAPLDTTPRSLDLDEAADAILGRWTDGDGDLLSEDDELEASDEALEEETDEAPFTCARSRTVRTTNATINVCG